MQDSGPWVASGPTRLSRERGRRWSAGWTKGQWSCRGLVPTPALVRLLLGPPAFTLSEHPSRPRVEVTNAHVKHAMQANTHIHVPLRKEPHTLLLPGASRPPPVCSKLICMNQVTKPTSRPAGERKQMLSPPGRIELSSLSLWLNSCLSQGTSPC